MVCLQKDKKTLVKSYYKQCWPCSDFFLGHGISYLQQKNSKSVIKSTLLSVQLHTQSMGKLISKVAGKFEGHFICTM